MARKREGKTETLNLRVSPDFKKRLVEEEGKTRRSVTNYLEVTLSDAWEQAAESTGKKRGQ